MHRCGRRYARADVSRGELIDAQASGCEVSEAQLAIHGLSYSFVFYDKLCYTTITFHKGEWGPDEMHHISHPLLAPGDFDLLQSGSSYIRLTNICSAHLPPVICGAELRRCKEPMADALQSVGCGFGVYTASELLAAAGLRGDEPAAEVMRCPQTAARFWDAMLRTGRQQLSTGRSLLYNPADVRPALIALYRSHLQVYKQAGSFSNKNKCKQRKVHSRGRFTLPGWVSKPCNKVLRPDSLTLGVGPFEWAWQFFRSSPNVSALRDHVQQDNELMIAKLESGHAALYGALQEWLRTYLDHPPQWATDLFRLA